MKYRILKPHEKPDRAKGDQYRASVEMWTPTSSSGLHTVRQIEACGEPMCYRRPVQARRKQVKKGELR
jgi:hypothetical protein